jgi:hypothetical protein
MSQKELDTHYDKCFVSYREDTKKEKAVLEIADK